MMGWELLLIFAVAGMFVLLVRRFPSALRNLKQEERRTGSTIDQPTKKEDRSKQLEPSQSPLDDLTESVSFSEIQVETNDFTSSITKSEESASLPPRDDITVEAADRAAREQNYPVAAALYEELIQREPNNPKFYNRLGGIYLEMERFHDARDMFRTVLKFGDQVAGRHANLAIAEYSLGHRLTAVRYLKRAVALAPQTKKYQDLLETFESERG